jgi:hypothetical protein
VFAFDAVFTDQSVLCKKYNMPVQFEYDIAAPYRMPGCSVIGDGQSAYEEVPVAMMNFRDRIPAHIDRLNLIVRQRVEISDTTFTMTTKLNDGKLPQ